MRIKLVFLSYGKLTEQIKKLRPLFPDEVEFESIDTTIDNIHEVVREVELRNEDCVLISSGANADLIDDSEHIRLPFVRIAVTGADILESLSAAMAYSNHIGVVSYKEKLPGLDDLAVFFPGALESRTFIRTEEIDLILDEFYSLGIRDVIGGSLVGKRAVIRGLRHYSLRSEASVKLAIENAVQLAKTNKIMATEAQRLKTILDFIK